jgi:hypothetical protein
MLPIEDRMKRMNNWYCGFVCSSPSSPCMCYQVVSKLSQYCEELIYTLKNEANRENDVIEGLHLEKFPVFGGLGGGQK